MTKRKTQPLNPPCPVCGDDIAAALDKTDLWVLALKDGTAKTFCRVEHAEIWKKANPQLVVPT